MDIFLLCITGIGAGIYFFLKGFSKFAKKRLIQNVPTSKVRSIAMGLVELYGKAVPDVLLTGPYTKTPCVFYHLVIERLERRYTRHGYQSHWVKDLDMKTDIPFFLKDSTGSVVVDPAEASTDLLLRYSENTGEMRYREYHIKENEDVYILGSAKKLDSPEEKIHNEVEKRLRDIIENPEKKALLDTNNDMWIDENEWAAAREKLRKEVTEEFGKSEKKFKESEHPVPEHLKNVVIGKGTAEKHFIISHRSEKEIIEHYKTLAFLHVFGGAALTIASLAFLLFVS